MNPLDQFKIKVDLTNSSNSNSTLNSSALRDSQNGATEEFKNFIMKEAPPSRNNVNLLSSQNLSKREISSSPIV